MVHGIRTADDSDWREREKSEAKALKNKKVVEISIKRAANGGHIVKHNFDNDGAGPYKNAEEHAFSPSQGKKMLGHVAEHMGIAGGEDE